MTISDKTEAVAHGLEMIAEIVKLLTDVSAEKVDPDEALGKMATFHDRLMSARSIRDRQLAERDAKK